MGADHEGVVVDIDAWRLRERPRVRPAALSPLLRVLYGEILRDERQDQDRTLAQVAQQVGMSKQYLSEIERGRKEPSSEILHSVCTALGLPVEQLLTRSARRLSALRRAGRRPASESRIELRAA